MIFIDPYTGKIIESAKKIGAEINIFDKVHVDHMQSFSDAAEKAGPQTREMGPLLQVSSEYTLPRRAKNPAYFFLVHWADGTGTLQKANKWAEENGLVKTDPIEIFAIGQYPGLRLNRRNGSPSQMKVLETTSCYLGGIAHTCYIEFDSLNRSVGIADSGDSTDAAITWYAYRFSEEIEAKLFDQDQIDLACDSMG